MSHARSLIRTYKNAHNPHTPPQTVPCLSSVLLAFPSLGAQYPQMPLLQYEVLEKCPVAGGLLLLLLPVCTLESWGGQLHQAIFGGTGMSPGIL